MMAEFLSFINTPFGWWAAFHLFFGAGVLLAARRVR